MYSLLLLRFTLILVLIGPFSRFSQQPPAFLSHLSAFFLLHLNYKAQLLQLFPKKQKPLKKISKTKKTYRKQRVNNRPETPSQCKRLNSHENERKYYQQ